MNDKDERTHQAHQASASQGGSGSGASGASGTRRKRRRRGGRGRGGRGRTHASTSASSGSSGSPQSAKPTNSAQHPAQQGDHNSNSHNSDSHGSNHSNNHGSEDSTAQPRRKRRRQTSQRSGAKGSAKNPQRSGNRRGQRGGHSQRRSSARGRRNNRRGAYSRGSAAVSHCDTRPETSAGGLVVSGLAEAVAADGSVDLSRLYVALIGRLDRRRRLLWSMPKGHVEPGEDHRSTAQREVWEETGISGEVFADLGVIDYWFVSEGVRIHKTVHHHLLRYVDGYLNDEDPEVTEVAWIPVHQLIEHLAYADERKLARVAHDILPDLARAEKQAGRRTPR
ncbi:putative mutator protein MutT4 [Corynebacterium oculi]|uniref:Putative mutator protein MutT4 n=2 Tax=Corynebacterium oculi TaxID=1544416 RepID=A0A0Q1ADB9_9CORY|nr:putative mutator protein MutT4 [Corynebacterium oculi]